MEFMSKDESTTFVTGLARNINLMDYHTLQDKDKSRVTYEYPLAQDLFQFSFGIAEDAIVNNWAFLFITDQWIFPSAENTHLYYSIRRYDGDFRSIGTAPGHLFLKHEKHDLASYISICISNCYDCLLLSEMDYSRFHYSHDGFLDVYTIESDFLQKMDKLSKRKSWALGSEIQEKPGKHASKNGV